MKLIFAFLISNILGVMYDYLYKIIFPHNVTEHKLYLNKLNETIIQLLLNTFVNTVISFRLLKGINYYRIKLLIRAIIQVGIFIILTNTLSS